MAKKKLTLAELRERAQDTDQSVLQVRKIMESYQAERTRIFSPENRRRLSEAGLKEDELRLRQKTEPLLAARNAKIAQLAREAFADKDTWTVAHALRTSRFAPESNGTPMTLEAQQRAINNEMLETFKRLSAENRAARYPTEDLIAETERLALNGDVATLAILQQEGRNRNLAGVDKVNFDLAFKKLQLPELDEAQAVFTELEQLASEADSLFALWKDPRSESALTGESLGRFNRKKKAEDFVRKIEAEGKQPQDGETQQTT